jgi:Aminoglycoside-2''-adenylyltransferase
VNDATATQLRLIGEIRDVLDAASVAWWLYGGWAMDFHAGEVTRNHSDIEMFVRLEDAEAVQDALGSQRREGCMRTKGSRFSRTGKRSARRTWRRTRTATCACRGGGLTGRSRRARSTSRAHGQGISRRR